MKIKQHAAEQPIGHQGNQRKSHKKTYRQMKTKTMTILRGKFIVIRPTASNKKSLIEAI